MTTSDYAHLAPQVRADVDLPDAQRARYMLQERFLMHERLVPLLGRIDFLLRRPVQSRAAGLVISGPPGSGKTMVAKALERRYPSTASNDRQAAALPVLMINMTNAREAKTLFNRILTALRVPDAASYAGSDREKMALKVCRQANVRLLVVDEIQDILSSTARQQLIALDTIKFLMNELSLPILALGTSKAPAAMQVDEHLNARFDYRTLPTWQVDAHLANFLATLEQTLPLREPSGLASVEMMKVLVKLSGGILDPMVKAVTYAAANAVRDGVERITIPLLQDALDDVPAWAMDDAPIQKAVA